MRLRRALVAWAGLAGLCAAAMPAAAGPDDRLERVERRQEAVERKLERVNARGEVLASAVAQLDRERARTEALVRALEGRIRRLEARVARIQARLEDAQRQLALLNDRLDSVQRRLVESEEMFRARAVSAYVAGPTTAIDALLSSEDLGDLLDRYALYQSALEGTRS
jgi:peptidoglycan hydrolase CwlO-like protein